MKTRIDSKIVLLGGPSGVGKSTIFRQLAREGNRFFAPLPRITTRAPRPDEIAGLDYRFVTEQAFESLRDKGKVIAPHEFKSFQYGIEREALEKALLEHQQPFVLCAAGFCSMMIRDLFPRNSVFFYLTAPEETISQRLLKRGDSQCDISYKINWARVEYKIVKDSITHTIPNHNGELNQAISQIYSILDISNELQPTQPQSLPPQVLRIATAVQ